MKPHKLLDNCKDRTVRTRSSMIHLVSLKSQTEKQCLIVVTRCWYHEDVRQDPFIRPRDISGRNVLGFHGKIGPQIA